MSSDSDSEEVQLSAEVSNTISEQINPQPSSPGVEVTPRKSFIALGEEESSLPEVFTTYTFVYSFLQSLNIYAMNVQIQRLQGLFESVDNELEDIQVCCNEARCEIIHTTFSLNCFVNEQKYAR